MYSHLLGYRRFLSWQGCHVGFLPIVTKHNTSVWKALQFGVNEECGTIPFENVLNRWVLGVICGDIYQWRLIWSFPFLVDSEELAPGDKFVLIHILEVARLPDGIHPNVIERGIHIPLYGIERPPLLKVF